MKRLRFLTVLLAICLLLSACGSAAPTASDKFFERAEVEMSPAETVAASDLSSSTTTLDTPAQTSRKLIRTVSMNAETEHYDELMTALEQKIIALGGYTESRRTGTYGRSNRWTDMTIRIPAEHLGSFLTHVTEHANVLSTDETTEDVTLQYVDTEAKIAALETEQNRLLELLAEAKNLSEILEIDARLSDVTYELERYASQKRSYDNLVSYATVHLSVEEVAVLTPVEEPTIWERISSGFIESLDGLWTFLTELFIFVVTKSPYLLIIVPIGALITMLLRKRPRKNKGPRQMPPSTGETE